ncbi:AAA ATPase [Nitrosococcus oceani ATCC 19707]|uniref:Uncharacterized AAA domain-containing protein ycf46 n=2 Tax=Nitrosococcus oceani TaxID=1229 RepID=Q3JBC8_NITOC|nr:AAA family ATPase [Nitrosococcus oceani]ABA57868.1 AAA ATPase [Nitrosococcus oceani ATCC 19707]EDZ66835.1 ATPase, AAA family protein [Nitrosococcus oceani AFC27]KFI19594.1 ATPase [Nitrosococcus oceani C-27]GEM19508.1 ATPase [Nitrosococcus oceani]
MSDHYDIELLIKSHIPIIVIETHEELRAVDLLMQIARRVAKPTFKWSVTEGLKRMDLDYAPQRHNSKPLDVLQHIKAVSSPGLFILADFHPYLEDPFHVRLLKDIALTAETRSHTLVLLSHRLNIPPELHKFSARAVLTLPNPSELDNLVREVAREWSQKHNGKPVKADPQTLRMLVSNLSGLTYKDAKRLARNGIFNDGAVTPIDLQRVMKAKYELLNQAGVLTFEYESAHFADIGGFKRLKHWLEQRRDPLISGSQSSPLAVPKGILLLGVQGCGKSLAAKVVAGTWGIPLLRLDFGALYNKFFGETERNLRESLKMSEAMAPCVLWIDEIEKGVSTEGSDNATSRRVLGTLLTWLAEKKAPVFMVATANDIEALPPELIRKGRFDEIFFVDLPDQVAREAIFHIHLGNRNAEMGVIDIPHLATMSEGFSGAEIEQVVVSAYYSTHAQSSVLDTQSIAAEIALTRPLSVTMAERIAYLRSWAVERTVPCD